MSYPDLELKVEKLRSDVCKIKERLYKLEDVRDEKEQVSADPSKLESNKDYALDWYINQYQNMCKEYNEVKVKLDEKQKVLEMVMDQRGRYVKQLMDAEKKVKEFEENIHNLTKKNQMLRGTIKNHEDTILELEKEVKYQAAFANSGKIKELEDDNKEQQNLIKLYEVANADMAKKIKELEEEVGFYKACSPEQYKIQYMQLKDMGSEIYLRNKFQLENEELTEENLKLKQEIVRLKKCQPHLVIKR